MLPLLHIYEHIQPLSYCMLIPIQQSTLRIINKYINVDLKHLDLINNANVIRILLNDFRVDGQRNFSAIVSLSHDTSY